MTPVDGRVGAKVVDVHVGGRQSDSRTIAATGSVSGFSFANIGGNNKVAQSDRQPEEQPETKRSFTHMLRCCAFSKASTIDQPIQPKIVAEP